MNMYDDYNKYIIENEELLNYLKDSNSSVMYCLTDVLEVLDYIYKKYIDEAKIDAVAAMMDAFVAYKLNRDAFE